MRTTLRPTTAADLPTLLGWIRSEAQLVQWSGPAFAWPLTLAQLRASLGRAADEGRLIWTAVADGTPVGHAVVVRTDDVRVGRLGRVVTAPERRGRGHGAAIVTAAVTEGVAATGVDVMTLGATSTTASPDASTRPWDLCRLEAASWSSSAMRSGAASSWRPIATGFTGDPGAPRGGAG